MEIINEYTIIILPSLSPVVLRFLPIAARAIIAACQSILAEKQIAQINA